MEETISRQIIHEGRALKLYIDTVRTVDARISTREIVVHDDCIAIVAVDQDENLLLVRQFRKAVNKELLEIPAGGIDSGESPEQAVEREMREETGFRPRTIKRLGGFYSAPGYSSEFLYLFLAKDLVPDPLSADDTPGIEVVRASADKVIDMITSGEIRDSKSIAGLLQYLFLFKRIYRT